MIYRWAGFQLSTDTRELWGDGQPVALQPQALAVLEYLVRHRHRAVPKRELLEALWPDAVVGEGSLRRAIHGARTALGDGGDSIRTIPRLGYRFVAEVDEVEEAASAGFRPRFVRSGEVHIAYHTIGDGEIDLVLVPGWAFPMRAFLDHPELRQAIHELGELGRVVLFDKRGTGLSDRVKDVPRLEQRADDLRAVLDVVASQRAVLLGYSEGGPLSLLYASMHPERIHGLVLVGSFARWAAAPDYPCGWSPEVIERLRDYINRSWGAGETIRAIAESRASDPLVAAWAARAEQEGASPGAALDLLQMNLQIDVRPLLPVISVPTAVLHHTGDAVIDAACSRDLAARIPRARLDERQGLDHVFFFEDRDRILAAIRWVLSQDREPKKARFLSTVLVAVSEGLAGSIEVAEVVARYRGLPAGGRMTFSFDGPERAVSCGHELALLAASTGDAIRIGVHAGEVDRDEGGLVGEAVDTASAIARAAHPGEVWVSRVVRDLLHGSPLRFDERSTIELAGGHRTEVLASPTAPVTDR